ncbi:hypothetical protein GON03_09645 [Nocardioides sp. MAH-18]|uniref:Uncharacterized protein n=1 Tax=Nocardioides agri TaxID=2682843 RepID=A0A6L6XV71_9ACTN|nr:MULTISPECIES: hypothetical protein [unclassified Nocardioides]MBA2954587.1 hypothetical protein [Nocardioides sp. CGMCC 1.13656]MVQ49445.1 hypothetical protein [Nocardioides sp. MAH-18]
MSTTAETFQPATFRRLVPAHSGVDLSRGVRIEAGSLVADGEQQGVVQLAGHMRYPTPRTVSTNRT